MQEEMAAVQPKLAEASKEVDSSMVLVEKEQSEVADLEKVVKSEDGLVNEKKKLAEQIRSDCDGELAEVSAGISTENSSSVSVNIFLIFYPKWQEFVVSTCFKHLISQLWTLLLTRSSL